MTRTRRVIPAVTLTALAVGLLPAGTPATAATARPAAAVPVAAPPAGAAPSRPLPENIALPNGFQPEGIAISGHHAYFGSRADGSIYRANLLTGQGRVISPGPGTPSVGVKIDRRGRLFVAGGRAGDARVVDTRTGRVLASYRLAELPSFVNDVILTPGAAWFTDSTNPVLYRLPFGRNGALPTQAQVVRVPLTGAIRYATGNNANGIARTPDGRALLIVQSNTGLLFRVDPRTGVTTAVDLGGENVLNGDGLLVIGRTLYVVQNRLNLVAVIRLDRAGLRGEVVRRVTDPDFDVPTTVAAFRGRLYLPNGRFTTPPTPDTPYAVVSIPRPRL